MPLGSCQLGSALQADPDQPAALQGLAVLDGDQFLHHPQGGMPLAFLAGHPAREDVRGVRGPGHVEREVADARAFVLGRAPQPFEDQPPMLDGLVRGLQVRREERGGLPAVAEQQQLAALARLVGLLLVGAGGSAWYSDVAEHGDGRVAAALEAPHHGRAPPAADQASGVALPGGVQPPDRQQLRASPQPSRSQIV